MEVTLREWMTALHGMMFGGFFLMAVFGVIVMRYRSMQELREPGLTERGHGWERIYLIAMVVLGWAAVLSGAYVVYPWYRAAVPAGVTNLAEYPQRLLLSNPNTVESGRDLPTIMTLQIGRSDRASAGNLAASFA